MIRDETYCKPKSYDHFKDFFCKKIHKSHYKLSSFFNLSVYDEVNIYIFVL